MTNTQSIDGVIDQAIDSGLLVGTVVMVCRQDAIVYRRAAGWADREAQRPMREDAIFRAASLTKPLVAATILAMAERNLLRLDDPVTTHLPYFRPRLADGTEPVIMLRHLLTHTAGLSYDYSRDPRISSGLSMTDRTLEQTLQLIAEQPLGTVPGTAWAYSMAIDVLGRVAEVIHGARLGDAVAHYVTRPLGMADTAFGVTDRARLAVPYSDGAERPDRMADPHTVATPWGTTVTFSPERILKDLPFQSGGGGMATTAGDYTAFLRALLAGGAPILSSQTTAMATADQLGFEREPGLSFSFLGSYTRDPARADQTWPAGTNNWGGVYGHVWSLAPAQGLAMVSLSNTAFYGGELAYPKALRHAVYSAFA